MQAIREDAKMVILFGTGQKSETIEKWLACIGEQVDYYTDNNSQKWGSYVRGKLVISPSLLKNYKATIIIATMYREEIEEQLRSMGIEGNIETESDVMQKVYLHYMDKYRGYREKKISKSKETNVFVDNLESTGGWGGLEKYAYTIAKRLAADGNKVCMFADQCQCTRYAEEKFIDYIDTEIESYEDVIQKCLERMMQNFPVFVIDNRTGITFMAAIILKELFPGDVKVLSIAHEDLSYHYKRRAYWEKKVDYLIGVSKKICSTFIQEYQYSPQKVLYKESFVEKGSPCVRKYSATNEAIRIGYAARLRKLQKRADLMPLFIEKLENSGIEYVLSIAGEGECKKAIEEYVSKRGIQDRVKIVGLLEEMQMPQFWMQQDVFVNFSEYEGMSLAMLEAMSYGVVPVVTAVSGTEEVIAPKVNGYIVKRGELNGIVETIAELYENKKLLQQMGEKSRSVIEKKCSLDEYIEFLERLIG